ncbi:hypothetical protein C9374_013595 [Naegleria lovaniensis]|uniref:EGF-like domain-containing protein n=1 Tax=Naegleria lovaniensis TaxID=51637 RepID=A0AA88KVU3_NAELO|nr:uncharacterized protein C9374_013595 [Naegleria lovaniensis]KAG2392110.1 hypothetical protein C9374_013595 [Naegleria lovaniensis]
MQTTHAVSDLKHKAPLKFLLLTLFLYFLLWSGFRTDKVFALTCPNGCTDATRGTCDTNTGVCQCNDLWTGSDCSLSMCGWSKQEINGISFGTVMGAPTPLISSTIVDSSSIQFTMTVQKHPFITFSHDLFVGSTMFNASSCALYGNNERVSLTLVNSTTISGGSNDSCSIMYDSQVFTIDMLINSNLTTKELLGDVIKLTIPLSMVIGNLNGTGNNGFCEAITYSTSQVIYFQINPIVIYSSSSFNSTYNPYGYEVKLYPQNIGTSNGLMTFDAVLESTNTSLISFTYFNNSNSAYSLTVTKTTQASIVGSKIYYLITTLSSVAISDYRGVIYFKVELKYLDSNLIVTQFIPFKIDYTIVVPPSDKNITLQVSMTTTDNMWRTKQVFSTEESVYSLVQSPGSGFNAYQLTVQDAYMCCFKTFVSAPTYSPSSGQLGCTAYDNSTMDSWKRIISNYAGTEPTTITIPLSSNLYGFAFKLSSAMFDSKEPRVCYLQANTRLVARSRSVSLFGRAAVVPNLPPFAMTLLTVEVKTSNLQNYNETSSASSILVGSKQSWSVWTSIMMLLLSAAALYFITTN